MKQSAPRALAKARLQFGVRSDVQARLVNGLHGSKDDRPSSHAGGIDLKLISHVFSCFVGVAKRHDPLVRETRLIGDYLPNQQVFVAWSDTKFRPLQ